MQISISGNLLEIKSKDATVLAGNEIKVNNFDLPGPGEYEIAGVEIFKPFSDATVFKLEEITIGYLNNLVRPLTDEESEFLSDVSIIVLTVTDAKSAQQIIKMLEPTVVIPIGDSIEAFCTIVGGCQEPVPTFRVTKAQLGQMEGQTIIRLNPNQ